MLFGSATRATVVAALAVVAVLFSGANTTASCGDYVHIEPTKPADAPKPPCPCEFGRCDTGVPFVPPAEPVGVSGPPTDDATITPGESDSDISRERWPSDLRGEPITRPAGVFHPPRA
jgi:hypothetical protein